MNWLNSAEQFFFFVKISFAVTVYYNIDGAVEFILDTKNANRCLKSTQFNFINFFAPLDYSNVVLKNFKHLFYLNKFLKNSTQLA